MMGLPPALSNLLFQPWSCARMKIRVGILPTRNLQASPRNSLVYVATRLTPLGTAATSLCLPSLPPSEKNSAPILAKKEENFL